MNATIRRYLIRGVYLIPIVFLLLFFFYPLASILQVSLLPDGNLDLSGVRTLLQRSYFLDIIWFTTWQATVSMLLTLMVGLPAAYIFSHYRIPGHDTLRSLLTVSFVMPTVVVATAFLALVGPNGQLNLLLMRVFGLDRAPFDLQHTIWIILLAHVFYNIAIVVRIVGGFWSNMDRRVEEAAAVLGAPPARVLREITLPLLVPAIAAAALLVFLFDFTSFGVILILGGPRYATIEVEIYRQTVQIFNLPLAATLSIVQLIFTFLVMSAYTRIQARASVPIEFQASRQSERPPAGRREWATILFVLLIVLSLTAAPLLSLVERSVTVSGAYSLEFYRALNTNPTGSVFYVKPLIAIRNSLLVALATMGLSVMMGTISAYFLAPPGRQRSRSRLRRIADPLFLLPLGTSAVTLGFGYIISLDTPPLNLRTSPVLLPLAHSLVAFPFVVRALLPVLRGLNPALREAAAVLGATPLQVLREIDFPIVGRALLVGAIFAFAISMGEFGATSLISRPEYPTMPIVIFRFLSQPGQRNYGQALAMSTLLMVVTGIGFILIERFRYGDVGEF